MTTSDRVRLAFGLRVAVNAMKESTKLEKCQRLGIAPSTLDKWLAGVAVPSPERLARVARVSGYSQETIRQGGADE